MKYFLFVLTLSFGWSWTFAQSADSAGTGRKPSIFERRERKLAEVMQRRQERAGKWAELPLFKVDSNKWSLSVNPLGVFEPQAAVGFGVGYMVTQHLQAWLESSALFQLYWNPDQRCVGGVREILAMKYYFGMRESLFLAGEFRWKDVNYHDVANFVDNVLFLPHNSYTYHLEDIVFGGAVWFGGRIRLSNDHRWRLEPSMGIGLKGRTVVWHGVPQGWQYQNSSVDKGFDPFPTSPRAQDPLTFYLPATVRLVYVM